ADVVGASAPPAFESARPRYVPLAGGTEVTLSAVAGDDRPFVAGLRVFVRDVEVPAADVARIDARQVTLLVPPGAPGPAPLRVVHPGGLASRRSGALVYAELPRIDEIRPFFLDPLGGTPVTVDGGGFVPPFGVFAGSQVRIGGILTPVDVVATGRLFTTAPPGAFGPADLEVRNPDLGVARAEDGVRYGLPPLGAGREATSAPSRVAFGGIRVPELDDRVLGAELVYAAGGHHVEGNETPLPPGLDPDTAEALSIKFTNRAILFDVSNPTDVQVAGGRDNTDNFFAFELEFMPESWVDAPAIEFFDRPGDQDLLLVANGLEGLVVLDATDPLGLPELSRVSEGDFSVAVTMVGDLALLSTSNLGRVADPCRFPFYEPRGGPLFGISLARPDDAVTLWQLELDEQANPTQVRVRDGRAYVATGLHRQLTERRGCSVPPQPPARLDGAFDPYDQRVGTLEILDLATATPTRVARVELPDSATGLALLGDRAVVSAYNEGLLVVDVTRPGLEPIDEDGDGRDDRITAQLRLDTDLVANPGLPVSVELQGNLAFVAAGEGGVQVFDLSDPDAPVVLSAGNTELARHTDVLKDVAVVAGGAAGLATLATPFSNVASVEPPRDSLVPTDQRFVLRFNRDTAVATVSADSVFLERVDDAMRATATLVLGTEDAPLDPADPEVPTDVWTLVPDGLDPDEAYRLVVTTAVRDRKGAGMLVPFAADYRTGGAGAVQPAIEGFDRSTVTPGESLAVLGSGFRAGARVFLGGVEAGPVGYVDETRLDVAVPESVETGSLPVRVENPGGLADVRFGLLLVVAPLDRVELSFSPEAGPRVGGTELAITADRDAFAPGARVRFRGSVFDEPSGEVEGIDLDVANLRFLTVLAPRADRPGLAEVWVENEGVEPVLAGVFSYDLPAAPLAIDLPLYPPRQAVDLRVVGDLAYVASANSPGLEIFDIRIPERPLSLGRVELPGAVRGVLPLADVALVTAGAQGFFVVDTSDPTQPFVVDQGATDGFARAVRVRDGEAWVVVANAFVPGGGLLQQFDLATPRLVLRRELALPLEPLDFELVGTELYVLGLLEDEPVLAVLDAETGAILGRPTALSMDTMPDGTPHLRVIGGFAFATFDERLLVLDVGAFADREAVGPETAPEEVFLAGADDALRGVDVVGGTAFVAGTDVELVNVPLLNVTEVRPAAEALAPVDAAVELVFSRPLKPSTATPDAIALRDASGAVVPIALDEEGGVPVAFTTFGSIATLTPLAPLAPGAEYEVRVTTAVTDITTLALAQPFVSRFRTAGAATARLPRIVSVAPRYGPVGGGTELAVVAQRLDPGFTLALGGQPVAPLGDPIALGPDADGEERFELRFVAPPLATNDPGTAALRLENPGGLADVRVGAFVYLPALAVESVSPDAGPPQGGNTVTVRGRGFLPGTRVLFVDPETDEAFEAGGVVVRSTETLSAVVPAVPAGGLVQADVELRLPGEPVARAVLPLAYTYSVPVIGNLVAELGPVDALVLGTDVVFAGSLLGPPDTFSVLDISDPVDPRVISDETGSRGQIRLSPAGLSVRDLARLGDDTLLAATEAGVVAVDVSLPAAPRLDAALSDGLATAGSVVGVAAVEALVLAADESEGLVVFDTALYDNALRLGAFDVGGTPRAVDAAADVALVSVLAPDGSERLRVLDLTTPGFPELASQELAGPGLRIRLAGNVAYVATGAVGVVQIFDLSTRTLLVPRGFLRLDRIAGDLEPEALDVDVVGPLAFVAAGAGGLQIFDASDRDAPVRIRFADTAGVARSVTALGNTAVAGIEVDASEGSVQVLRLDGVNVASVEPADLSLAPQDAVVRVALTGFVDPDSVDASSFFLTELVDTNGDGIRAEDGPALPATIETRPTASGTELELVPDAPLAAGAGYRVHVTRDVLDLRGDPLLAPWRSRFDVSDVPGAAIPEVDAVEPAFALWEGGDELRITGRRFQDGVRVLVGGVEATVVSRSADGEELRVLAPALPTLEDGDVTPLALRVVNPGGLAALTVGAFNALPRPQLDALEPEGTFFRGPEEITLRGRGFFPGTRVELGGLEVAVTALLGSGELRVEPPDGRLLGTHPLRAFTPRSAGELATAARPLELRLVSRARVGFAGARGLALDGTRLYAALGAEGLREVAVIDPGNPQIESELALPGTATRVAAGSDGQDRLLLVLVDGEVRVVRALPGGMRDEGPLALPVQATATDVDASDDLGLVVADGSLVLVRLDRPERPLVDQLVPAGAVVRAAADGGRAWLIVREDGVDRIEARDLRTPGLALLGALATDLRLSDLAVDGDRGAAVGPDGLLVLDVSDPAAPLETARLPGSFAVVAVQGALAAAADSDGVRLFDLSDPAAPVELASFATGAPAGALALAGDVVHAAAGALEIIDQPVQNLVAVEPAADATRVVLARGALSGDTSVDLNALDGAPNDTTSGPGPLLGLAALDPGEDALLTVRLGDESALIGDELSAPLLLSIRGPPVGNAPEILSIETGFAAPGNVAPIELLATGVGLVPVVRVADQPATGVRRVLLGDGSVRVSADVPALAAPGNAEVRLGSAAAGPFATRRAGFTAVAPLPAAGDVAVGPMVLPVEGGAVVTVAAAGLTIGTRVEVDGAPVAVRSFAAGAGGTLPSLTFSSPAGGSGAPLLTLVATDGRRLELPGALVREDSSSPRLVATSPVDTQRNVAVDTQIVATFSEAVRLPVDPASAFRLLRVEGDSEIPVPGDYTEAGTQLVFDPLGPGADLPPDARLRLVIEPGIEDLAGNPLSGGTRVREFTTVDTEPPALAPSDPTGAPLPLAPTPIDVPAGSEFSFRANGSDSLALGVVFFTRSDGVLGRSSTDEAGGHPFSLTAPDTAGELLVTITARDFANRESTATLRLLVFEPVDDPPGVRLTAPLGGATLQEGSFVDVEAEVSDDMGVVRTELLVGPDPASLVLVDAAAGAPAGGVARFRTRLPLAAESAQYVVAVRALDARGQAASDQASVLVSSDATPPAIALTSPAPGASLSEGAPLLVAVTATDNVDVAEVRVTLTLDGAPFDDVILAAPYQATFALPAVTADATLRVAATARDGAGNPATATPVDVTVVDDAVAPSVYVVAPLPGAAAVEGEPLELVADARDDRALSRVSFVLDGAPVGTVFAPPWRLTVRAPEVAADRLDVAVEAIAFDTAGNSAGNANPVAIAVLDDPEGPAAPGLALDPDAPVLLGGSRVSVRAEPAAPGDTGTLSLLAERPAGTASVVAGLGVDLGLTLPVDASALRVRGEAVDAAGNTAASERSAAVEAFLAALEPAVEVPIGQAVGTIEVLGTRWFAAGGGGPLLAAEADAPPAAQGATTDARDVAVAAGAVWVAEGAQGLAVLAPDGALGARLPAHESIRAVAARGPIGYALDGAALRVVELRADGTLAAPLAIELGAPHTALAQATDRLVVAGPDALALYDLSDPLQPVALDVRAPPAAPVALAFRGDRLAVALGAGGVALYDTAGDALAAGALLAEAPGRDLQWSGDRLLAIGGAGLHVFDASSLAAPQLVGRFPQAAGRALALAGERLLVASDTALARFALAAGPATPALEVEAPDTAAPGAIVRIGATATDDTGVSVTYALEGAPEPFAQTRSAPHEVGLRLAPELLLGEFVDVRVVARDQRGQEATAVHRIALAADGAPPELLAIGGPGTLFAGQRETYRVRARDHSGIAAVSLEVGGAPQGELTAPPFEFEVEAPAAPGTLALRARARDAAGNEASLDRDLLVIGDGSPLPPTVSLLAPADGTPVIEGRSLRVAASAEDPDGAVLAVEFELAGRLVGRVAAPPYELDVELPLVDGFTPVSLAVRAIDDGGNRSAPAAATVNVNDDTLPPDLAIEVEPDLPRLLAGTTLRLRAVASDETAVASARLEVEADGSPLQSGLEAVELTVPAEAAALLVRAQARDRAGNATTAERRLEVVGGVGAGAPRVLALDGMASGLAAVDQRLWVAAGAAGVRGFDLDDPTAPVAAASYDAATDARAVVELGDRLLVADGAAGLLELEAATGAVLSAADTVGPALHLVALGELVFTAEGVAGVGVFELRPGRAPRRLAQLATADARRLAPAGAGLLLLADGADGVKLLDVSRPARPVAIDSHFTGQPVVWAGLREGAVLTLDAAALRRLEASSLNESESLALDDARALASVGALSAVVTGTGELVWLERASAGEPREVGRTPLAAGARDVAVGSGFVAVASGAGIEIVPFAGRATTADTPRGQLGPVGIARRIAVADDVAYVASGPSGVQVVDVGASPPARLTHVDTPGAAADVAVLGRYLVTADGFSGIRIQERRELDAAVPGSTPVSSLRVVSGLGSVTGLALDGDRLYAFGSSLSVVDLRFPNSPVVLASGIATPGEPSGLAVADGIAVLAAGSAGLRVLDVSDPSDPIEIGAFEPGGPGLAEHVVLLDGYALVAWGEAGLRVLDVRDPTQPRLAGELGEVGLAPVHVSRIGSTAVLSDGARIVWVDVTEPETPRRLGSLAMPDLVESTAAARGQVLAAAGPLGVQAVELGADLGVPAVELRAPRDGDAVAAGSAVPLRVVSADDRGAVSVAVRVDGVVQARLAGPRGHELLLPVPSDRPQGARLEIDALAIDAAGRSDTARPVTLQVDLPDESAPLVSWSAPDADASAPQGGVLPLRVDAEDDRGAPRVQLLADGALITTLDTEPFAFDWVVPLGVAGAVELRARALDASGNVSEAARTIDVVADAEPPVVSLTGAVDGTTLAEGSQRTIGALASDDASLRFVEWIVNGATVAVDVDFPYQLVLEAPPGSAGSVLEIEARAEDGVGRSATTPLATVTVIADAPPRITRFDVSPGLAVIEATDVSVVAQATDEVAVAGLRLLLDGTEIASSAGGFLSTTFTAPEVTAATDLTLELVARDASDQESVERRVLRVSDDAPPAVLSIESDPLAPLVEGSAVRILVSVADDVGVERVELDAPAGTEVSFPVGDLAVFDLVVPALAALPGGTLDLTARAFDRRDQVASDSVALAVIGDAPPAVTGLLPAEGAVLVAGSPLVFAATAADDRGLARVRLEASGSVLASPVALEDDTPPFELPLTLPLDLDGIPEPRLDLRVTARDDLGQESAPLLRSYAVVANVAPVVTIAAPLDGAVVGTGTTVTLVVRA
ncbi:MAG: Ig-like domain-containing protein, partial [Myxococcota bacterium]|nr:Ig-like domain-containing protein [Myxococcota bacterium]